MFSPIKRVFIVLLSFSSSLAHVTKVRTKYLSLNDERCMVRSTPFDLNHVELKYYPFTISLDKWSGSCTKSMCFKRKKDITVKAFNMIANKNEAKTMTKHISCGCKCKFNSTTCNSNQKWNDKTCQCEYKNYRQCKKDYSWNPSTCICEKRKYLKVLLIHLIQVTAFDEITSVMDIVSTKKTNTIATNVSINCHTEKVRYKIDCYILHAVLLAIIILLIITIICYYYAKI